MTPGSPFMTEEEASAWLRVSRNTLIAAIQRKEVPGVRKIGRAVRLNKYAMMLEDLGTDVGTLAKQLGVTNIDELFAFLDGKGSSDAAQDGR